MKCIPVHYPVPVLAGYVMLCAKIRSWSDSKKYPLVHLCTKLIILQNTKRNLRLNWGIKL